MNNIDNSYFVEIVKSIKPRVNQTQLADRLNLSKGYISDIFNNKKNLTDEVKIKFENIFGINIEEFTESSQKKNLVNTPILDSKNQLFKSIPFYDINVSAGNIVFLDDGLLKDKEPDDWFDIPKSVDADIAFPTYGHSMSPVITNGDKVAYKFITDWSFFNYGMKYMIVTDEQRMVKYLRKHEKEEFILLESENPEYDPIDMPISSVRHILQVRYIGKIEM
ncbi:LexA family transcriptional regulator [Empedobacter brevis]|uniref:LexA family transcriptional regulator n=1 Tax=Empedobacter brevis TaxID=247 RepID=UPI0028A010AA|nr:S24 family peptidase [Empedobacter brevis]